MVHLCLIAGPALFALVLAPLLPWGLRPDPFIWPVVFLALFTRERQGWGAAFLIGLVHDLCSVGPFLGYAVLCVLVFHMLHTRRGSLYRESTPTLMALTAGVALAVHLLQAAALMLSGGGLTISPAVLRALLVAIPTGALAPVAFVAIVLVLARFRVGRNSAGEFVL